MTGSLEYRPLVGKIKKYDLSRFKIDCYQGDHVLNNITPGTQTNLSFDQVNGDFVCTLHLPKLWIPNRVKGSINLSFLQTTQLEFISKLDYALKNSEVLIKNLINARVENLKLKSLNYLLSDVKNYYVQREEFSKVPFPFYKTLKYQGKANVYQFKAVADKQITDRGEIYFLSYIVTQKLWVADEERLGQLTLDLGSKKIKTKKILSSEAEAESYSFEKYLDPVAASKVDFELLKLTQTIVVEDYELNLIKQVVSDFTHWRSLNGGSIGLVRNQFGLCYYVEELENGERKKIYDLGFAYYTAKLDEIVGQIEFSCQADEFSAVIPFVKSTIVNENAKMPIKI